MGNGLSIFIPRPGPGSSGAKNRNPGNNPGIDPNIARLLPDYYPIVTHFYQIFILFKILSFPALVMK